MPAVGAVGWLGGLAGLGVPAPWLLGGLATLCAGLVAGRLQGRTVRTALGLVLAFGAVAIAAQLRSHQVSHNPVVDLARARSAVGLELQLSTDPRLHEGRFEDYVVLRGRTRMVAAAGRATTYRLRVPVLVMAPQSWAGARIGETVRTEGRLAPATDPETAAVLMPFGAPSTVSRPAWWWRASDRVRASLRESVGGVPEHLRALVPALVVGDDEGLDATVADDFRTTGLTHLLAVSGTNLTLVLGFLLGLARGLGLPSRGRHALAALGIVGFVLLARPEPSVLRAAVMGAVALVGLGTGGRRRGGRSLGVAVIALLLVDPWLARSAGFALSALATAGIVFVAPVWRDALSGWLPRWLAEAVAVPAAAQLACTPVVAALSGQVSLVAVATNLLAAPAVGPATVLGLAAGLCGLAWGSLGRLLGTLAGWCVGWIVAVAELGAGLPLPAVGWGTGPGALAVLTALCVAVAAGGRAVLRRPATGLACCALLVAVVVVRPGAPGWPTEGWVLAACDVGQGDALVINAGSGAGVVVDAGPDPVLVDRCLSRLEIRRVPLLVLTHFHRDHVGGVTGVLHGRVVDRIEVTALADPPDGVATVGAAAAAAGVEIGPASYALTRRFGEATVQVLWPLPSQTTEGPGDGSTANNASVVLLATVHGVRLLLTGDVEPPGQAALARSLAGLTVDVLKVPHHGSRFQDLGFLLSLDAEVALVSVGVDNDYGHPAEQTLEPLRDSGVRVLRTDLDGDLLVIERDGRVYTRTSE